MRVLIPTNHETHSAYDSIYGLARSLSEAPGKHEVFLMSTAHNQQHFACDAETIRYHAYHPSFTFDERNEFFAREDFAEGNWRDFDAAFFRIDRVKGQPDAIYDYFKFVDRQNNLLAYVNSPAGLLTTKSKAFLTDVAEHCPEFIIAASLRDARKHFIDREFVLKPLDGYGGSGIVRVHPQEGIELDGTRYSTSNELASVARKLEEQFPMVAMEFLPRITEGDKRVLVVGGECLGAFLRVPSQGSWLATLAQGASSEMSKPDDHELAIIEAIDPVLQKAGITIYGIDTIVGNDGRRVLSEINTANVGGFRQIEETTGRPIMKVAASKILERLNS